MKSKYFLVAALLAAVACAHLEPVSSKTWDGDDYHKNSNSQQKEALKLLDEHPIRGDESILDVGCGDGKITAEIANRVPEGRVLGIDKSVR